MDMSPSNLMDKLKPNNNNNSNLRVFNSVFYSANNAKNSLTVDSELDKFIRIPLLLLLVE